MQLNKIHHIDVLDGLPLLAKESVHCCVSSVPYYALRDYNLPTSSFPMVTYSLFGFDITIPAMQCCLGLEENPKAFIGHLVHIYRGIRPALRKDGTCWLNIGDSYNAYKANSGDTEYMRFRNRPTHRGKAYGLEAKNLKPKDLLGIPWMLAFALREDGWYLRQDIIWHKPNPMPESITDRCTKAHEYVFLLTKSAKYYFDAEAIKTDLALSSIPRLQQDIQNQKGSSRAYGGKKHNGAMKSVCYKSLTAWQTGSESHNVLEHNTEQGKAENLKKRKSTIYNNVSATDGINGQGFIGHSGNYDKNGNLLGNGKANKRSVWSVPTMPYKEAHFATFPEDLIVDCIKAGSSEFGCCRNCGSPYSRRVNKELIPGPKASYNSKPDTRDAAADSNDHGSNGIKDGHKPGWVNKTTTEGWVKTCSCITDEIKPAVVLDPFMGAGTTAVVAGKLLRSYIGFELNPDYITIANKRLHNELGLFTPQ